MTSTSIYISPSCPNCGKTFSQKHNKFCCSSCSASYNNRLRGSHSLETKLKQSIALKGKSIGQKVCKVSFCIVCSKTIPNSTNKTCSQDCYIKLRSDVGKRSASTQTRRSKDEISLFDLCCKKFSKVAHNEPLFNGWDADILIYDTKTAILWNGPWHYREMGFSNHSLTQVQNRDKIKAKEILDAGWNLVIFEDRYFTPESAFVMLCDK